MEKLARIAAYAFAGTFFLLGPLVVGKPPDIASLTVAWFLGFLWLGFALLRGKLHLAKRFPAQFFGGLFAFSLFLPVALEPAFAWCDELRLRTIQQTFQGLSRDDVYGRLHQMALTPVSWDDTDDHYIVSTAPFNPRSWPSDGDVELDFKHATRKGPDGTCGANARTVLLCTLDRSVSPRSPKARLSTLASRNT